MNFFFKYINTNFSTKYCLIFSFMLISNFFSFLTIKCLNIFYAFLLRKVELTSAKKIKDSDKLYHIQKIPILIIDENFNFLRLKLTKITNSILLMTNFFVNFPVFLKNNENLIK